MRGLVMLLAALAGIYGAAGVALAAAGAHLNSNPTVTTAAYFLLFHAGALVAIAGFAREGRKARPVGGLLAAGALIAAGVLLFSGDLALRALAGITLVRLAAPTGGVLMIIGWLVAAVALPLALRRDAD